MSTLPTNAQAQPWMGLTRQQVVGALVLLMLIAALAFALLGAAYSVGGMAASVESFVPIAGAPRCPRGCI